MKKTARRTDKPIRRFLALAVGTAMLFAGGCQFVEYDKEADMAQVVAEIGDVQITKGEVLDQVEATMEMYVAYYGIEAGSDQYKELETAAKQSVFDSLVELQLVLKKAEKEGTTLTEDEKKDAQASYDDVIAGYEEQAKTNLEESGKKSDEITDADVKKEVDSLLKAQGYTRDKIREAIEQEAIYTKYNEAFVKDLKASAEQIKQYYDQQLETQKKDYDESISNLDSDFSAGSVVLYYPVRCVLVTQVLVKISDEEEEAIDALKNDTTLSQSDIESRTQKLLDQALPKIKSTADKVYDLAKSGEDFAGLIDKYNDDPGMEEALEQGGYLVHEDSSFYNEFEQAALALKKAGDISKPVTTEKGYHIICAQTVYDAGHEVPFDSVKAKLTDGANEMAKTDAWKAHIEALKTEFGAKLYEDRL